jgi:hypothetical protein
MVCIGGPMCHEVNVSPSSISHNTPNGVALRLHVAAAVA